MNLNKSFAEEFDKICQEEATMMKNIKSIRKYIGELPPLTNLNVCKKLEDEHLRMYEYTTLLANTYMKLSQLYHYTRLINEQILDDQNIIKYFITKGESNLNKKIIVFLVAFMLIGCVPTTKVEIAPTEIIAAPTMKPTIKPTPTIEPTSIVDDNYYGQLTPEPITLNIYDHPYYCDKLGDPHKVNGYYYNDPDWIQFCRREEYFWIPGLLTYESQFMRMPDLVIGKVYGYEANLMEHTAMFHELNIDNVRDGITLPFCSEIGGYAWVKRPYNPDIAGTGEWEGPFRVVDCAGVLDLYNVVVRRKEVAEVGFQTAVDWGMVKDLNQTGELTWNKFWDMRSWYTDIMVSKIDPKYLPDDLEPIVLADWFAERATFYETQEEWDNAYKPLPKTFDQVQKWRFEPNGEWVMFDLNEIE